MNTFKRCQSRLPGACFLVHQALGTIGFVIFHCMYCSVYFVCSVRDVRLNFLHQIVLSGFFSSGHNSVSSIYNFTTCGLLRDLIQLIFFVNWVTKIVLTAEPWIPLHILGFLEVDYWFMTSIILNILRYLLTLLSRFYIEALFQFGSQLGLL